MTAEESAKECLEQEGFLVDLVPTAGDPRPDLIARWQDEIYVIEVKEKYPDLELLAERQRSAMERAASTWTDSLEQNKRVSEVLRKAAKQVRALQGTFRLAWLYAKGPDPDLQIEQFVATFYGKATVIDWGVPDGQKADWPCYYYSESDFFRHRNVLDGAVILRRDGALLCVNDVAPNYDAFLSSRMAAIFDGATLDPRALELAGPDIMVVRGDVDRRDEKAVNKYLSDRYGCKKPLRMPMQQITAAAIVEAGER